MQRHHDSYLLRVWRDHDGAPLRATLTAVGQPNIQHHFAHLDDVLSFLVGQAQPARCQGLEEVSHREDSLQDECTPHEQ